MTQRTKRTEFVLLSLSTALADPALVFGIGFILFSLALPGLSGGRRFWMDARPMLIILLVMLSAAGGLSCYGSPPLSAPCG